MAINTEKYSFLTPDSTSVGSGGARWILTVVSSLALVLGGVSVATAADAVPAVNAVGKIVVSDSMTRSSHSTWGAAPIGGRYSSVSDGSFSVNAGVGLVKVPGNGTSRTATLSSVSVQDASASVAMVVGSSPKAGNGIASGLQLRSAAGSYYRGSIKLTPAGKATISIARVDGFAGRQVTLSRATLPSSIVAGKLVFLEFKVTGTTDVFLSARAWANGAARPSWQATAIDSSANRLLVAGAVGFWSYVSVGTSATRIFVDNLLVKEVSASDAGRPVVPPVAPRGTPVAPPAPPVAPPAPPTDPAPPTPPVQPTTPVSSAGSAAVGQTAYPVPAGALFVSPQGDDRAAGEEVTPLRSVAAAISLATTGGTIVLRAGSYHEGVTIPSNKRLTIQSYPGEAAWFEGSKIVSTWAKDGAHWSSRDWTAQFDSSPTYSFGAPDGSASGWQFVSPSHPMAAHPDQLWINGAAQKQVASLAQVSAGTFFVDYANRTLYAGSDPTGATVRASDIAKAISIRGAGSIIRGLGIQRFAPSVAHMGAVTAEAPNITVENVVINDTATTGLFVMESGDVIRNVTLLRNGMLGSSMTTADNLTVTGMLARNNNTEHFNNSPVSGGLKISRSRNVDVSNSDFSDNYGPGLWFDESVYNGTIAGTDILDNAGHGLILEISSKFVVVNNIIAGNSDNGIKLNDTSQVSIWNNTLTGNGRSLNIVQDSRRASNRSTAGHDPRQAFPDPTMTWVNDSIEVRNNVVASTTDANCLLCVEDYSRAFSAAQMAITSDGNIYHRASAGFPQYTAIWAQGSANALGSRTLDGFVKETGQDAHSVEITGSPVLNADRMLVPLIAERAPQIGLPLPATIARIAGVSAAGRSVGAWAR